MGIYSFTKGLHQVPTYTTVTQVYILFWTSSSYFLELAIANIFCTWHMQRTCIMHLILLTTSIQTGLRQCTYSCTCVYIQTCFYSNVAGNYFHLDNSECLDLPVGYEWLVPPEVLDTYHFLKNIYN